MEGLLRQDGAVGVHHRRDYSNPQKGSYLHASGAINADDLAIDPLAILTGQEGGDAGNINGHADAVGGRPGGGILVDLLIGQVLAVGDVLLADLLVHVGLDAAGGDDVDGDLLVAAVDGHAADEGLDGALAAGVDSVLGHTLGLTRNRARPSWRS